ncbi:MAG: ion transporter [Gammaproteobacteria bacterium]|nr:MAG: ion transporter [Gammaproteobacteria bacterium]
MNIKQLHNKIITLRHNNFFEFFVVGVIVFSALVIGFKTYEIPSVGFLMLFLDWFITIFFLFEIGIRFIAESPKKDFFKNGWNLFDTTIVIISLIPIEDSQMAIIGRLIRIFRVLRMVSLIPELRFLLNSLMKALPQLSYVMLLMFIIFYIYGAIGSTIFGAINPVLWGDVGISMLTLFRVMTFEDWTDVMYETMVIYPWSWIYYLSFIFFTAFAFLNMVIGVVVNTLSEEQSKMITDKQDANKTNLEHIMTKLNKIEKDIEKTSK